MLAAVLVACSSATAVPAPRRDPVVAVPATEAGGPPASAPIAAGSHLRPGRGPAVTTCVFRPGEAIRFTRGKPLRKTTVGVAGNLCTVQVVIGAATTDSNYYAFAFDVEISDTTVAQFVSGHFEAEVAVGVGQHALVAQVAVNSPSRSRPERSGQQDRQD